MKKIQTTRMVNGQFPFLFKVFIRVYTCLYVFISVYTHRINDVCAMRLRESPTCTVTVKTASEKLVVGGTLLSNSALL